MGLICPLQTCLIWSDTCSWFWDVSQNFSQCGIHLVTINGSELELEVKPLCHWLDQMFWRRMKWRFHWHIKCRVLEDYKIAVLVVSKNWSYYSFCISLTKATLGVVVPRSALMPHSENWDQDSHYDLLFLFFKGEIWFQRRQGCMSIKSPSMILWSMYYVPLWNCFAIQSWRKLAEKNQNFINVCPRVWLFFSLTYQWSVIYHYLIVTVVEFGFNFLLVVRSAPWKNDSLGSALPN